MERTAVSPGAELTACHIRLSLRLRQALYRAGMGEEQAARLLAGRPGSICRRLRPDCQCPSPGHESCRRLGAAFRYIHNAHYRPGQNPVKDLERGVARARKEAWPVVRLESLVALAKVHRERRFDLGRSVRCAHEGLDAAGQLADDAAFGELAEAGKLLAEVRWSLANQKAWTLIYFRRTDAALQTLRKHPPPPGGRLESRIQQFQECAAAFVRAYDRGRGFGEAVERLLQLEKRCGDENDNHMADQAALYRAFALILDPATDNPTPAETVFADLAGRPSSLRSARIYAHLGLAVCARRRGARAAAADHLARFHESSAGPGKTDGAGAWKHRTHAYPWFVPLEMELAAETNAATIDEQLRELRRRCDGVLRSFESMRTLQERLLFAPQVYAFYRARVRLLLAKHGDRGLNRREILWLAAAMERSRKCAVVPWFAPGDFDPTASGTADLLDTDILPVFNAECRHPAAHVLEYSRRHHDILFVFTVREPAYALVWVRAGAVGIGAPVKTRGAAATVEALLQAGAPAHAPGRVGKAVVFCDDEDYRIVGPERRRGAVYYAEDLFRLSKKLERLEKPVRSVVAVFDPAMDTSRARGLLKNWCAPRSVRCNEVPATELSSADEFFEKLARAEAAIVFAHGLRGEGPFGHRIALGRFALTAADIYRNAERLTDRSVCLCCCGAGEDVPARPREVLSMGSIMVSLGARMAYCPLYEFDQRDFGARVTEFAALLDNKAPAIPPDWRVIV